MDASLAWLVLPALYAAWNVYATARGLAALPQLPDAPSTPTSWPKVSVVVPARDEMAPLEKAPFETRERRPEIVLVDDRSTDCTSERSVFVTQRQGGVFWRGTFSPLAELRKLHSRNSPRLP